MWMDSSMENIMHVIVVYNMVNFKRSHVSMNGLRMFGSLEKHHVQRINDIILP